MKSEYPIIKTLRLDPLPIASLLESVIGDYLLEPLPGIYAKGKFEPVMVPEKIYHQHGLDSKGRKTDQTFVVSTIDQVQRGTEVLDLDGNVAVTVNQIPFLSDTPTLPSRGMEIIERSLRDLLSGYGDQTVHKNRAEPVQLYIDIIKREFRPELELVDQILGILSPLRGEVKNFAGDNRWIVHFLRRDRFSLLVEKSLDFRIIDWHRIKGRAYD
jgi:hypothetical protein